jgi:glutathione synthase/RimK-type ligase-like ATP-grasp enzyme
MPDDIGRDAALNRDCFCITLDGPGLRAAIRAEAHDPDLAATLLAAKPHLFSNAPVFLSSQDLGAMVAVVAAIEAAADKPAYQAAVLEWAPAIARHDLGPRGVFMGYDFHLGSDGPRLIEVNTNAGGAFLNAFLARAQTACCREAEDAMRAPRLGAFEPAVWRMFLAEWELQGRANQPRTIAIVDDRPQEQYLYPEFLLAQGYFERQGMKARIVDPTELRFADGRLHADGETIDLVYNRLVDFSLGAAEHEALREAYLAGAVVVTPNPRNHALLADKRNLSLLSDPAAAGLWGISADHQRSLSAVPRTRLVTGDNAEELWATRKQLFFKPAGGHGGKAVYRGDKITHRVWAEIQQGGYIAQTLAPPSERRIRIDGEIQSLKLDVRLYTYGGSPLLMAARVYQGQTTNFRTPGGGFAPVFVVASAG